MSGEKKNSADAGEPCRLTLARDRLKSALDEERMHRKRQTKRAPIGGGATKKAPPQVWQGAGVLLTRFCGSCATFVLPALFWKTSCRRIDDESGFEPTRFSLW
ncbi:MAG TPA: hypothetical protein VFB12_05110 [Ktedonobacteraceae bacterium]|nr:hypothetical protein [Ktedonobacteraceae bacterium]